jgi:hypothetical protein
MTPRFTSAFLVTWRPFLGEYERTRNHCVQCLLLVAKIAAYLERLDSSTTRPRDMKREPLVMPNRTGEF